MAQEPDGSKDFVRTSPQRRSESLLAATSRDVCERCTGGHRGAAAVALLLYCYFENVKEENDFVQSIKRMRKVVPPAGGA